MKNSLKTRFPLNTDGGEVQNNEELEEADQTPDAGELQRPENW